MSTGELVRVNELAEQINLKHGLCIKSVRAGLEYAIEAGELLRECKGMIEHGGWLDWISANCMFSERTAQNYMRLAENKDNLLNTQRVAHLSYREAVKELSAPVKNGNEIAGTKVKFGMADYMAKAWHEIGNTDWAELTPVGLNIVREPTFDEWFKFGKYLMAVCPELSLKKK